MSDQTFLVRVTIHESKIEFTNKQVEALTSNAIADEIELGTSEKVQVTAKAEHVDR